MITLRLRQIPNPVFHAWNIWRTPWNKLFHRHQRMTHFRDIFDAIIKLFNEFQPEFIASCLNTEQQKQYIYNHIDEAVKQRLQLAMNHARAKASRETSESHSKMTADIARLRELNASLEAKKDEFQSEKLSASRQKRALNERVHDLEAQINNLKRKKNNTNLKTEALSTNFV